MLKIKMRRPKRCIECALIIANFTPKRDLQFYCACTRNIIKNVDLMEDCPIESEVN